MKFGGVWTEVCEVIASLPWPFRARLQDDVGRELKALHL